MGLSIQRGISVRAKATGDNQVGWHTASGEPRSCPSTASAWQSHDDSIRRSSPCGRSCLHTQVFLHWFLQISAGRDAGGREASSHPAHTNMRRLTMPLLQAKVRGTLGPTGQGLSAHFPPQAFFRVWRPHPQIAVFSFLFSIVPAKFAS